MMIRLIAFALAFLTGAAGHALGAPNARQNMDLVNRSTAAEFGEALEPYIPNRLCVHDNYCQGLNSEVVVSTVGRTIDAKLPNEAGMFGLGAISSGKAPTCWCAPSIFYLDIALA